jgi:hypothetical protein
MEGRDLFDARRTTLEAHAGGVRFSGRGLGH